MSIAMEIETANAAGANRNEPDNDVPREIVSCMMTARRPENREIAKVAARIWKDCFGWQARTSGFPSERQWQAMLSAARIALGDRPGQARVYKPVSPHEVWWRPSDFR